MNRLSPWEEKWLRRLMPLAPFALLLWFASLVKAIWSLPAPPLP